MEMATQSPKMKTSSLYTGCESDKELKSAPAGKHKAINAVNQYTGLQKNPAPEMEEAFAERDMVERLHSIQGKIGSITVHVLINGAKGKPLILNNPRIGKKGCGYRKAIQSGLIRFGL